MFVATCSLKTARPGVNVQGRGGSCGGVGGGDGGVDCGLRILTQLKLIYL